MKWLRNLLFGPKPTPAQQWWEIRGWNERGGKVYGAGVTEKIAWEMYRTYGGTDDTALVIRRSR